MSASRLIQIVPARRSAPEGVGDYARLIAERMEAEHGITTSFISCTPLPDAEKVQDRWETIEVADRSPDALLAVLDRLHGDGPDIPILLQLSGYGFHRKGVSLWVDTALRRWQAKRAAARLMTVFHELRATGPIWSGPFWFGWAQAWSARRLLAQSVAGIATTRHNVEQLRAATQEPPLFWMPCFATIGEAREPECVLASARPARLVIFGRASVLDTVYGADLAAVERFVQANAITEIVDLGGRPTPPPAAIAGIPVIAMGELDAAAVSAELSRARFGMLAYEADRLAKSSIFAAYAAHGTIPVCLSPQAGANDALEPGRNYLKITDAGTVPELDRAMLDELQAAARCWYEPHSIRQTVHRIHAELIAAAPGAKV